jgi:uncharacterized 2Fe-2S/4Fe-4S cluster protein (DUF4445 family)
MPVVELELRPEPGRTLLELISRQTRLLLSVCGGRGRCGKCRVRVITGRFEPATKHELALLNPGELAAGIRLACSARAVGRVKIALPDWTVMQRPEETAPSRCPRHRTRRIGLAIDIGTTNVAVEAYDMVSGRRLAETSFLNPQMSFGLDVVSRIAKSAELIRDRALPAKLDALRREWGMSPRAAAVVGNTAMCHFLLGADASTLGRFPYTSSLVLGSVLRTRAPGLGRSRATILPLIGAFLGADVTAGIVASGIDRGKELSLLIDLGTNGEIVLGNRDQLLACSTAAGPALEGANLSCGVLARDGAITDIVIRRGRFKAVRSGRARAIGLCGSAVIRLLAELLRSGRVARSGRLGAGPVVIVPAARSGTGREIELTQGDVREFQLAKAAIAAGISILLRESGAEASEIRNIYLTGMLGGHLNAEAAQAIGLLPRVARGGIRQSGNLALAGARLALLRPELHDRFAAAAGRVREIALSSHQEFTDEFVARMELSPWA